MSDRVKIECPESLGPHVLKVIKGEYAVPLRLDKPVVLDIGANVGSFAIWATMFWPGCRVHCYEPSKDNFAYLEKNIKKIRPNDDIQLNNLAVGDALKTKLFDGLNNCGERSLYDIGEQSEGFEIVKTIDPMLLPQADVLKMDTEGSELDILERITSINYKVIMFEYHSEQDRRTIDEMLKEYSLIGGEIRCLNRGVLKYIRNDFKP